MTEQASSWNTNPLQIPRKKNDSNVCEELKYNVELQNCNIILNLKSAILYFFY